MVVVDSERHNMVGPNRAAPMTRSWGVSESHGDDVIMDCVATRVWERRRNFRLKNPSWNSSNAKPSPCRAACRMRSSTCGMSFNVADLKVTGGAMLDDTVTGSNLVTFSRCSGKEVEGGSGIVALRCLLKMSWNRRRQKIRKTEYDQFWAPSQYKDRLIYVWRFPC